jgi:hypothetical protein
LTQQNRKRIAKMGSEDGQFFHHQFVSTLEFHFKFDDENVEIETKTRKFRNFFLLKEFNETFPALLFFRAPFFSSENRIHCDDLSGIKKRNRVGFFFFVAFRFQVYFTQEIFTVSFYTKLFHRDRSLDLFYITDRSPCKKTS